MITNRVKNYLILGLLALLLISGTLNIVQLNSAKQEQANRMADNLRNQIETAGHIALAKSYADRAREVDSVRTLERDSTKVVVRALKDETKAYKKTIAALRPLVGARIDSVPQLRDFVAAQDSTILKQDSTITSLEIANANEIKKATEIDELKRSEINEMVLTINGLQESVLFEQGETRKYKKQAGKRFGLGINAGWGVMSTGGEIRTGPVIQAGLQWRLLRF